MTLYNSISKLQNEIKQYENIETEYSEHTLEAINWTFNELEIILRIASKKYSERTKADELPYWFDFNLWWNIQTITSSLKENNIALFIDFYDYLIEEIDHVLKKIGELENDNELESKL